MKLFKIVLVLFISGMLLNACQKEYSVEDAGLKLPVGNWEFADSTHTFTGNMDTAYIVSSGTTKELHLEGKSSDGSQNFNMILYADSFKVGSYKASLFQSSFDYMATAKTIYQANQLIGEFIVNITSLNNNLILGTFSGTTKDSTNKLKQLTQGKFKSTFGSASVTPSSSGVLGDSSGNCKPVVLSGAYSQGVAVTAANTVVVQVAVAVAGTYSISTNTVNGITFSGTGAFASVGAQSVTLTASGTPAVAGSQTFTVKYGNSQCAFKVDFVSPSSGTLGGGGGNCTPFIVAGTYTQGIPLNAGNTLQIQVNVTTLGGYNITSNLINGVSFSKSGTFTTIGLQNVLLTGNGTPVNAGAQNFAITFGTSTCNFSLTFLPGAAPSGDYFPLTLNSNWTYGLAGGTPSDSVTQTVIKYSPSLGGKTYQTITSTGTDSFYYRKPGGDYYQYFNYSDLFGFDKPVSGEFIFLKDNVAANITWQSPTISGTISGIPISGYAKMTLLAKGVSVTTIGNFNFPDVIKVKYEYFITGSPVVAYTQERWFAKNVGEIYNSSASSGVTKSQYEVGKFIIF